MYVCADACKTYTYNLYIYIRIKYTLTRLVEHVFLKYLLKSHIFYILNTIQIADTNGALKKSQTYTCYQ